MSWLRYSDDFTVWPEWDLADTEIRWSYVCLIEACSRGKYWDGCLPKKRALAALAGQVEDPQQCIERLAMLSLLHESRREQVVTLVRAADHIPPPGVRKNAENSRFRMRRKRAHDADDHSLCTPDRCPDSPVTAQVTDLVTRNSGTGRDGTGKALPASHEQRSEGAS